MCDEGHPVNEDVSLNDQERTEFMDEITRLNADAYKIRILIDKLMRDELHNQGLDALHKEVMIIMDQNVTLREEERVILWTLINY